MPVGNSNGKFFKDDFEAALDEYNSGVLTPPKTNDAMEIDPVTREEPEFDPSLKEAQFIPTADRNGQGSDLEGPFTPDVREADVDYLNQRQTFPIDQTMKPPQRSVTDILTGMDGKERYQLWPERMIRSLGDSVRKLATGEVDPTSPEGIAAVTEVAGSLVLGPGAPTALGVKLADGTLGSFAGVRAKTADHRALQKALSMDAMDVDKNTIWKETGFFKGADERWRFEIPEPKVDAIKPLADWKEKQTLGDILDHPKLYEAYPELKKFPVELEDLGSNLGLANKNRIALNPKLINSEDNIMRVLTHEIQHVIQRIEHRPSQGSNPAAAGDLAEAALRRRMAESDVVVGSDQHKEMLSLLRDIQKNKKQFSEWLYERNPGEAEANLAMRRYETQNYAQAPWALQDYMEFKGMAQKPVSIPEIESSRFAAMAGPARAPFPEGYLDKVPSEQRRSLKGISHPGYRWEVYDKQTGKIVRKGLETRGGATRSADRLDNQYGSYRYGVRNVVAKDLTEAEKKFLDDNGIKLQAYDGN